MTKKYKKRLTDEEIVELLNNGKKIKEITFIGVAFRRIKKIINKYNINYVMKKGRRRKYIITKELIQYDE